MKYRLKQLAAYACVGMFIVLMMGALVTKTDSGRGCGDDWPLCNGKFVPAYTIESLIEWSHRFVTGLEGLLIAAVFYGVWRYVKQPAARWYVSLTAVFTVIQSLMGAAAVKWPQSASVMALHFGLSLLAFACSLLLYMALKGYDGRELANRKGAERPISGSVLMWSWISLAACYVVVYLGAYVKHRTSSGGCMGWPLCNGQWIPELTGAAGTVFLHRVGALALLLIISVLAYKAYRSDEPVVRKSGLWAIGLMIGQVLSGAFVTYTIASDWYLLTGLIHAVLVTMLFGVLSFMCSLGIRFERRNVGQEFAVEQEPLVPERMARTEPN